MDCPPAPAATSSTRLPERTFAMVSISSVTGPNQLSIVGPQRCHASDAASHWSRVVCLYLTGSNCWVDIIFALIYLNACLTVQRIKSEVTQQKLVWSLCVPSMLKKRPVY